MPDGSSSAAPVTNPGPSSRSKIFGRLSGDLLGPALDEFMAHSSNKAMRIARVLCSAADLHPVRWTNVRMWRAPEELISVGAPGGSGQSHRVLERREITATGHTKGQLEMMSMPWTGPRLVCRGVAIGAANGRP
jgi:hypothetical protein